MKYCLVLALILVGCVIKRAVPLPPMPVAVMSGPVATATYAESVIGPPSYPRYVLRWNTPHNSEVYITTNLSTWTLVTNTSAQEYPFFAARPYEFFKVRAYNVETYQVKSNGVWINRIHTNYSNWATTQ